LLVKYSAGVLSRAPRQQYHTTVQTSSNAKRIGAFDNGIVGRCITRRTAMSYSSGAPPRDEIRVAVNGCGVIASASQAPLRATLGNARNPGFI
jgi:hypothetical protein